MIVLYVLKLSNPKFLGLAPNVILFIPDSLRFSGLENRHIWQTEGAQVQGEAGRGKRIASWPGQHFTKSSGRNLRLQLVSFSNRPQSTFPSDWKERDTPHNYLNDWIKVEGCPILTQSPHYLGTGGRLAMKHSAIYFLRLGEDIFSQL